MNKEKLELKYIEKIKNDIDEKLYDLLMVHLLEIKNKIKKESKNLKKLIKLFEDAIYNLKSNLKSNHNTHQYRFIIMLINKILYYNKDRQDMKNLKKKLIEDYVASPQTNKDKIPLYYQINEVRITYDVNYLTYLINKFIENKLWAKALYCLITVRLVEPDNEKLDKQYEIIKKNMNDLIIPQPIFKQPKDSLILLDANIVIMHMLNNIKELKQYSNLKIDLKSLGNKNNTFKITPSVRDEIKSFIKFELSIIKQKKILNYEDMKIKLNKKYEKTIRKYLYKNELKIPEEIMKKIKKFYSKYLNNLEQIILQKIKKEKISKKLRKIAQRESLFPENGDLQLLGEALLIQKQENKKIIIASNDKDFTRFAKEIKKEFKIEVYDGK